MMTQLYHLSKCVVNSSQKGVNIVGATSDFSYECVPYDSGYSEEVHYLGIKYWVLGWPFEGHPRIKVRTTRMARETKSGWFDLEVGKKRVAR